MDEQYFFKKKNYLMNVFKSQPCLILLLFQIKTQIKPKNYINF